MSLLDRVQKKAEEGGIAPSARPVQPTSAPAAAPAPAAVPAPEAPASVAVAPAAPAAPLPVAPIPAARSVDTADAEPPPGAGWGVRKSGGEPAPEVSRPAIDTPRPAAEAARPAPEPVRPAGGSALLNRTGSRPGAGRPGSPASNQHSALRSRVHSRLIEEMAGSAETSPPDVVKNRITELVSEIASEMQITLSRPDKAAIAETVVNDVLGLGPLEQLLSNSDISEIMINGPKQIYVEQKGKLILSPMTFDSNQQLMQVIDRIVSSIGRRVDESSPMCDARLKDGSRVNVIIPPLALRGPTMTIRKFSKEALTIEDLVKYNSVTEEMVTFMRACVRARLNVVVSGGTGSGKTTTLNILSSFIPEDERIVTIEDAAELQLRQEHVVTLETRPANVEGRGRVTIRDLVINSLRMRPDRIVIGECRGGEALDMLQAMNTGHDGSLTTLHANNPRECISRLETMVLMAGAELPSRAIREQIGSAIHLIVQQSRLRDGTRKIVSITECLGVDGDQMKLQEIFTFKQTGIDEDGKVIGQLMPTGVIPNCLDVLQAEGEGLPETLFRPVRVVEEEPEEQEVQEATPV